MVSPKDAHPRVFISYSWSSDEHQKWVLRLAEQLREHGVDAILDQWDLKPGQDIYRFMEKMVTDPRVHKVVVVCDEAYRRKADSRKGGVGTESEIISAEIYTKSDQTKFVPIVTEFDSRGNPCLPVFLRGRMFIDFRVERGTEQSYLQLLAALYDEPLLCKPDLGIYPAHLLQSSTEKGSEEDDGPPSITSREPIKPKLGNYPSYVGMGTSIPSECPACGSSRYRVAYVAGAGAYQVRVCTSCGNEYDFFPWGAY